MKVSKNGTKCIILANGKPPAKSVLRFFSLKGFEYLICADGGANSAFKLKIIPDLIIGDLDSINQNVRDYYTDKVKIIELKRQNDTDVEKALKYAVSKGIEEVALLGATGDRLDHTFCNIGVLLKFSDVVKIYLYHEESIVYVIKGRNKINCLPGEIISIYGIDKRAKFKSVGLKYSLEKISLPFGTRESTSNVAQANSVELNVSYGKGIIIRNFKTIAKHDLLFDS